MIDKQKIVLVHPDPSGQALLASMLQTLGHPVDEAADDRGAVRLLERGGVGLVVAGVDPANPDALELLVYLRRKHHQTPAILLFTSPHPERTREALRMGAASVLRFPAPATELRAAVTQAIGAAPAKPAHGTTEGARHVGPDSGSSAQLMRTVKEWGIVGNDPCLRQALEIAATLAPGRGPLLIVGELGAGKSLLARTIHHISPRGERAFVAVEAAGLAHDVESAEDEGFDPVENGPTAAALAWSAAFDEARGGTLHLKDVGALPESLQAELLQTLHQVGTRSEKPGDAPGAEARIVMSSREPLAALVERGKFRADLYHHISVVTLNLTPLRHRRDDIETLAEFFRDRYAHEFGKNVVGFTHDAHEALRKHEWPGNVGELEGAIRRATVLCQGRLITSSHLEPSLGYAGTPRHRSKDSTTPLPPNIRPLKEALAEPEKRLLVQTLQSLNWNRQDTARALDINRTTLYKKMKKYGLLVDEPIWAN